MDALTGSSYDKVHISGKSSVSSCHRPYVKRQTAIYINLDWWGRRPRLHYIYPFILRYITNWGVQIIIMCCIFYQNYHPAVLLDPMEITSRRQIQSTGIKYDTRARRLPFQPVCKRRSNDTYVREMETFAKVLTEHHLLIIPIQSQSAIHFPADKGRCPVNSPADGTLECPPHDIIHWKSQRSNWNISSYS